MRNGIIAAALLLLASSAQAQVHECEQVTPTTFNVVAGEMVRVGVCAGLDITGAIVPVNGFEISQNGGAFAALPMSQVGVPAANGQRYYETVPFPAAQGGTFVVRVISSSGTSLPSTPVTVNLSSTALPAPPTGLRIVR